MSSRFEYPFHADLLSSPVRGLALATVSIVSTKPHEAGTFDASIALVLRTTASSTKAEVAYETGQFQVCGTLAEVRKALPKILTLDVVKICDPHASRRGGNINKIVARVAMISVEQLSTCREFLWAMHSWRLCLDNQNFIIHVHGASPKLLEAIDMRSDELPARLSSQIPESYHRRTIGKGGASV
jgi:hypothetical protein